jgi:hypothetical protein
MRDTLRPEVPSRIVAKAVSRRSRVRSASRIVGLVANPKIWGTHRDLPGFAGASKLSEAEPGARTRKHKTRWTAWRAGVSDESGYGLRS